MKNVTPGNGPHPYALHLLEGGKAPKEETIACGRAIMEAVKDSPQPAIMASLVAALGSIMVEMPFSSNEQYQVMTDYVSIGLAAIAKQTRPTRWQR